MKRLWCADFILTAPRRNRFDELRELGTNIVHAHLVSVRSVARFGPEVDAKELSSNKYFLLITAKS